jgi:hypothetical protein
MDRCEGAMLRYLHCLDRSAALGTVKPFQKLATLLLDHLDAVLSDCRTRVPIRVAEAIHGNIKTLFGRGRGYQNLGYLLLKAQPMAATQAEFIVFRRAA